jgi:hypothetical protein
MPQIVEITGQMNSVSSEVGLLSLKVCNLTMSMSTKSLNIGLLSLTQAELIGSSETVSSEVGALSLPQSQLSGEMLSVGSSEGSITIAENELTGSMLSMSSMQGTLTPVVVDDLTGSMISTSSAEGVIDFPSYEVMVAASFVNNSGVPLTGLSPIARVRDLSNNAIVADAGMEEVGDGGYKFIFSINSLQKHYFVRCDAGVPINNRYKFIDMTDVQSIKMQIEDSVNGLATIQSKVSAIPTNPLLTSDTRLGHLDVDISSRLADLSYTAPDNTGISTIKSDVEDVTIGLGAIKTAVTGIPTNSLLDDDTRLDHIDADITSRLANNDSRLDYIDTYISSRLSTYDYTAPDNATISTISSTVSLIKTETDKIKYVLGLSQENFRLKDMIYNTSHEMTGATVRVYDNASDCTNDVNPIAEYTITATWVNSVCTSYVVTKV